MRKTSSERPLTQKSKVESEIRLGFYIVTLCTLVTLVTSSSISVDAFNPIKFFFLNLGIFSIVITFVIPKRNSFQNYVPFFLPIVFSLSGLNLFLNQNSISERLFGISGRSFGFLTVVNLFFLGYLSYVAFKTNQMKLRQIFTGLSNSNFLVMVVYFLQKHNLALTDFQNTFKVWPSTLGNPNFISAFLAISLIGVLGLLSEKESLRKPLKFRWIQIPFCIYTIWDIGSFQGLVVLFLALTFYALTITYRFLPNRLVWLTTFFLLVLLGVFFLCMVGMVSCKLIKPQETLIFRTIYWQIGVKIFSNSPLYGNGFDSYGDYFRLYLDAKFQNTLGKGVISDSPHNIFLDLLIASGLTMSVLFLALLYFSFQKARFIIIANRKASFRVSSSEYLIFILVSYLFVAMISPFQLSLFVWLPVVMGVLIATGSDKESNRKDHAQERVDLKRISTRICLVFILLCSNPWSGGLPLYTDTKYRQAIESGDFIKLKEVALSWPFSPQRSISIAQGMLASSQKLEQSQSASDKFNSRLVLQTALSIASKATAMNPIQYESWQFLYYNSRDEMVKSRALRELRLIDPHSVKWRASK